MLQTRHTESREGYHDFIHPTLLDIIKLLNMLNVRVFLIGARSIAIHNIDIGRETQDWDITIDKPFTQEIRDRITRTLRNRGFKVQWRKWGFLVDNDIHVDINYAPITLDHEFIERSRRIYENLFVPSLEDLIILKLMSGERKDIDDLKKIIHQAWGSLDRDYLYRRARQAGLDKRLDRIVSRLGLR